MGTSPSRGRRAADCWPSIAGTPGRRRPREATSGSVSVGVEDVLGFRARARDGGLEEVAFQHAGGFAYCRVLDPDGHAVEVYAVG